MVCIEGCDRKKLSEQGEHDGGFARTGENQTGNTHQYQFLTVDDLMAVTKCSKIISMCSFLGETADTTYKIAVE